MGGLVIICSVVLAYFMAKLITQDVPSWSGLLLLFLFVGLGTVGFLDDYIKIAKQRSLGLRSKAKMLGQTLVAVVFGVLALTRPDDRGQTPASHSISFIRDLPGWTLPSVLVVLLILVMIAGASNAVNLTDGLDGLATGAIDDGLRRLHAGQHLAEQPVVRAQPGPQVLRGARPAGPRRRSPRRSPAPASASCGGTPRRPRSSWATPARCRSAARSPASRS